MSSYVVGEHGDEKPCYNCKGYPAPWHGNGTTGKTSLEDKQCRWHYSFISVLKSSEQTSCSESNWPLKHWLLKMLKPMVRSNTCHKSVHPYIHPDMVHVCVKLKNNTYVYWVIQFALFSSLFLVKTIKVVLKLIS